ncbi:aftiphilin-like isoform X2 [Ylistrum balloti]|uniref:aftiphilin-like isoform X2 n=1 Tax=Ylistrum balloti TaxID=509963 RepID=UPI002905A98D|nr:aftiphilin-like isoform X2 [Ylistrum balloti]
MSNFIPMVSSSPPPLEDGGGFNDWDDEDDDFGTFATATIGNDFQSFSDQSSADQWNNIPNMPSPPNCDFGKFADFSNFSSDSKVESIQNGDVTTDAVNNSTISIDSKEGDNEDDNSLKSSGMKLSLRTANDFVNNDIIQENVVMSCDDSEQQMKMHKSQSGNLDSISSVISAGDSGLCSTDISPVPQSDDNVEPEDKSQESDLDDFGDFHSESSVGKEASRGSIENMAVIEEWKENVTNKGNVDDKYQSSSNSDDQVSNRIGSESVNDQEIRTSQIREDNMCGSVSEQRAHEHESPLSNMNQNTCTSFSDTSKDDHSTEEKLTMDPTTEGTPLDASQITMETFVTDQQPDVNIKREYGMLGENSETEKTDIVKDTCVQEEVILESQQNCVHMISDEMGGEHCHNKIDSDSSDVERTDNSNKEETWVGENKESTEITVKHSDAPVCGDAELSETFHKVDDNEINCESTEQSQEMKDSGFVLTDLSSSEEESCEKKDKTDAKLEENCDISKKNEDDNEKCNVIDNEDFCENSVSSENEDLQMLKNVHPKQELSQISDDEFDDFADFNSASQFSVPDCSANKSGNIPVANLSPPFVENKSATLDINNEDDEEFDDFADFHSSKPVELDKPVSESLPQTISNGNEKSGSDLNSGNCDNDVDDDFDSFADFNSHFSSESSKNDSGTSAVLTDKTKSGSVSFDAFPSASAAEGDHEDEDDWATFQTPPTPDQVGAGSNEDDDFGDFEDFEHARKPRGFSNSSVEDSSALKQPKPAVTKPMVKRSSGEVITSCFPESCVNDQDNKTPLLLDDCCHGNVSPEDKSATGPQLWAKLKSPNSTIQLSKLWSESHSNSKLFTTLRIDTRNILLGHRKPSVPMYAANLTLLEPTKGPTPPAEGKSDANKLVDMSKSDDKPASQDLPPVQFDWSNSGLTNPLEANSKSLELDFLVVKETEAVAKMGVFDSELMHGQRDPKTAMQPLENILANLKTNSTMRQVRPAENLTPEATKVISSLPNLSFMKARALMFPFKQSSDVA